MPNLCFSMEKAVPIRKATFFRTYTIIYPVFVPSNTTHKIKMEINYSMQFPSPSE